MIRIAAQVSVYGGARGKEAAREINPRSCYRVWRRAFLGGAGAFALLAASAVAANAQAVDNDVAPVPNNTTPVTITLNALAIQPGVIVVDVPLALVTADASAIIRGPAVATPVSIVQLNSAALVPGVAQALSIDQNFEANALAFAGDVDITNTLITGNTTGLSRAGALAAIDAVSSQRNENLPATTNLAVVNQSTAQSNAADQDFSSFAWADSGIVDIDSSGDVTTALDGVNADSIAAATAHVGNQLTQSNENQLIGLRSGNNESITQSQSVAQENSIDQDFFAVSLATADDVLVTRSGATTADLDGVDANSAATASADVASNNSQANINRLSGTTTGAQTVAGTPPFVVQNQSVAQDNESDHDSLAASIAASGDVAVAVTGDTYAGGNGVNANSVATATASNNSTTTQSNQNSAAASTTGNGGFVAQGPVSLSLSGSVGCPGLGCTTFSGTRPLPGDQAVAQTNENGEIAVAATLAVAGDVNVTDTGYTTAGGDGVNANSVATATSAVDASVSQSNTNSLSASTQGGLGTINIPVTVDPPFGSNFNVNVPLPISAFVAQEQNVEQTNLNGQILVAASGAFAGDVTVTREGNTDAGGNGINANSVATATSAVDASVTQSNTNSATATTQGDGAFIAQDTLAESLTISIPVPIVGNVSATLATSFGGGQDVEQLNANGQVLAAASLAASGDVTVSNTGNTLADGNGINAISAATASADVGSGTTVNQTNTNSLSATTNGELAPVLQEQDVEQINLNGQLVISAAGAFSGDVNVTNSGDAEAGGTAINAASVATANATKAGTVTQTNDNSATGTANGDLSGVTQGQDVDQFNVSAQLAAVVAGAASGDVTVSNTGNTKATGEGINAASVASATANSASTTSQTNKNAVTGTGLLVEQEQGVIQANGNLEAVLSTAIADSGSVSVTNSGDTEATANGILATSAANATAGASQTVTQGNENAATATGSLVLQGQGVLQVNGNLQAGASIATATSDYVYVGQDGELKTDGFGIVAASSAVSTAGLTQTATQTNKNSADITLENAAIGIGDITLLSGSLGVQGQLVGQLNLNAQEGASIATSVASFVDVYSDKVSSGATGITASSAATSTAGLSQTATQSNNNSATITLPPIAVEEENGEFIPPIEIAAQLEGVLQLNLSNQDGVAVATSISDYVNVQSGELASGTDGIVAASSAVSTAGLSQTATQSNKDAKVIDRAAGPAPAEGEVAIEPLGIGVQLEAVLQANASEQEGLAVATSVSGPVTVLSGVEPLLTSEDGYDEKKKSKDDLDAKGDGIVASSAAVATAGLSQTATQSNENSVDATGALVLQGQLVGQLNFNEQRGAAIATAVSDYVLVDQGGSLKAGGNGIVASSTAVSTAGLSQTATQTNKNSATATLESARIELPTETDLIELGALNSLGLQGQLVGQFNFSEQEGASIATSLSSYVDVYSDDVSAVGTGITATSSAVSTAGLSQTATQANENNATITLPAAPVVPNTTELPFSPVEIAAQLEGVLQLNVNDQDGLAVATSVSDYVNVVQTGSLTADGDGIVAISSAVSTAGLSQTATQSNTDTKTIARAAGDPPAEDEFLVQPSATAAQLELVLQANANEQEGLAVATSVAGPVTVLSGAEPLLLSSDKHGDKNGIDVKGDGITATSAAVATAGLTQDATQTNTNGVSATGGEILQLQLVGQLNVNEQSGASIATAVSDYVFVDQAGTLKAGGDGITASSSAVATAGATQTASQSNNNSATGTLEPPAPTIIIGLQQLPGLEQFNTAGVQAQLGGQFNFNEQNGAAIATAVSSTATVYSDGLTAGGAGISATSSAVSTAGLSQTATQTNTNSANLTLPALPVVPDNVPALIPVELAAQLEGVLQLNVNDQDGLTVATSVSDEVLVDKDGTLSAGGDGIIATSSAVATAGLSQTATQSNNDTKVVERAEGTPPAEDERVVPAVTAVVQLEGVLQANVNEQEGASIATSVSGPATVLSKDKIDATGNGITANSSAEATAGVSQAASQSNTNSMDATGTAALQGQLVGQINLNEQSGASIATAISDYVFVDQDGTLKSGADGINATSSAVATAGLSQTATQSNSNSASATLEPSLQATRVPVEVEALQLDPSFLFGTAAIQAQLVGQLNVSEQNGAAIATALSGYVDVDSVDDPSLGNGITAASTAVATAALNQTVNQSNTNTADITLPPFPVLTPNPDPEPALIVLPRGLELALQLEGVLQVNVNDQDGLAVATAVSDYVTVDQNGPLSAGLDGITATSSAVATAGLSQEANQSNSDVKTIDRAAGPTPGPDDIVIPLPTLSAQLEGVLQLNLSEQQGAAIATAASSSVEVWSNGELSAGGNGINATSSAVATAGLAQEANQSNSNSVTATGSAILQGQLAAQINWSEQEGAAVATAASDYVTVDQLGSLTAGGNGITAVSSAVATAGLSQEANQSNSSSATGTLEPGRTRFATVDQLIIDPQLLLGTLGIQGQLVGQLNVNDQDGASIATALSSFVEVRSFEDPSGGDGITATSSAVATAGLSQVANQSNSNAASITLPAFPVLEANGPTTLALEVRPDELAIQLEGVLQANINEQEGLAVATAASDYVTVDQTGELKAGGDAITATSSAVATAGLSQEAIQSNSDTKQITRAAGPTPGPDDFVIVSGALDAQLAGVLQLNINEQSGASIATALSGPVDVRSNSGLWAGGDGINATSSAVATAGLSQTAIQSNANTADATGALVLQGQLVGQVNWNEQEGAAIATAVSDYVDVDQNGYLKAGGDGITATSSAVATAGLAQTVSQSNSNSADATLEAAPGVAAIEVGEPGGDLQLLVPVESIGAQLQLAGQLNVNDQDGLAIATAVSSYVDVYSYQDPSGGDGITATSSAVATAGLSQTATQSNENAASITLPALPVVPTDDGILLRRFPEVAAQLDGVLQLNVSEQEGLAVATAVSDYVSVDQSGALSAGGDGITATSSAVATAGLEQSATQSNSETKEIARAAGPTPGPNERVVPVPTIALQLEGALQANLNEQSGAAIATASSGSVEVNSRDALEAYGDGINATSSAVAVAGLSQTVDQSNTSAMTGTGTSVLQGQLVGQANINLGFEDGEFRAGQEGAAIATAVSGEVYVNQSGWLDAGENGITATSSAVAVAALEQTADQSNSNAASATLEPQQLRFVSEGLLLDVDLLELLEGTQASQVQFVGQVNLNTQDGLAVATAVSDYVEVISYQDPSGGNGITATSSAEATAALAQTATQSNENSASITLPPLQLVPTQSQIPLQPDQVAEQAELVVQANLNFQEGAAIATAVSDSVYVDQTGVLSAGGNGITATSSAVAVAALEQSAVQSNTDTKDIARADGPAPGTGQIALQPETFVAQEEFVLQANLSKQEGAAVATAASESVIVKSSDTLSAGGDGISATSSAVAAAALSQSVEQSNINSVTATGTAIGGMGAGQFQEVSQTNLNGGLRRGSEGQEGLAVATAVSGNVYVDQSGSLTAGGNGISATSSAVAAAALEQTATQSNSNNASAFLEIGPQTDRASQAQDIEQANLSSQAGAAISTAISEYVEVKSVQDPSGGDGITATSSAVAAASLGQSASQANENAATIELPFVTTTTVEDQRQEVEQTNLNEQEGATIATAVSDFVKVEQSGLLEAGGDGITATSSAVATAALEQTATQSNNNSARIVRVPPQEGQQSTTIVNDVGQSQRVRQLNVNEQEGAAIATASSDSVAVKSLDTISAGGDGINATSEAVAVAALNQSAEQVNANEQAATAANFRKGYEVTQTNVNDQDGAAIATAFSDYVSVEQSGVLSAGGNGITATSSAVAKAELEQTASQSNSNAISVALEPGSAVGDAALLLEPAELIIFDGQTNVNEQEGLAIATAVSGEVEVYSAQDPSGGDGISATSEAVAVADLGQSIDQTNNTSQSVSGPTIAVGNVSLSFDQGQTNLSEQEGAAFATAHSDYVSVEKSGWLEAGGDGIDAESNAVAIAKVEQQADQENTINQSAALESGLINLSQSPVAQSNINSEREDDPEGQAGLAVAGAHADYVWVNNSDDISAGGDGINAESTAVTIAKVEQEANQTNTNSQNATTTAAPSEVLLNQNRINQSNVSEQDGFALSVASSDEVKVTSWGDIGAGEDGIDAESSAVAVATVHQDANQTNTNSQAINQSGCPEDPNVKGCFASQSQDNIAQQNLADQEAAAIAVAVAGSVTVEQTGYVSAWGDGIDAQSSAVAFAGVEQEVNQDNTNSQLITRNGVPFGGPTGGGSNESDQDAYAIAVALSEDVTVNQYGSIDAGGDGIKAISSAVAVAKVEQTANQNNNGVPYGSSEQRAGVAAVAVADDVWVASGNVTAEDDGIVAVSAATAIASGGTTPLDLALVAEQYEGEALEQLALPINLDTLAVAVAQEVNVFTFGKIDAGGNGIVAVSYAKAEAEGDNPLAVAVSQDVNVEVNNDVKAKKTGIYAASIAEAEQNGQEGIELQGDVSVAVNKGTVSGGSGYYGIVVQGGDWNTITIGKKGAVTSKSRHAIFGGDEDETVENYGLVDGDVDLTLGNNAFNNYAGARFYSGSVINLNGGLLWNAGQLSPGGPGIIQTSELNGSLEQTNSGEYEVDVELKKPSADFVHATGSASLDGSVDPTIIANPASGKHEVTILTADGGVTNNGLRVGDTALVDYSLRFPNPNDVVLKVDVDFAAKGLDKEGTSVGSHLNKVFKNGASNKVEALGLALLQLPTVGDVSNAYDQLSGENYRALGVSELHSQERFSEDQMSCPVRDGGAWAFIDENQCVYARVRYRNLQQDANAGTSGSDEDAVGVMGGAQFAWNGPWHAGVAVGYENSDLSTNNPTLSSDGDRYRVGGSVKYIAGPWFAGGAITGNWSNYDSTRQISFPGFASVATSDQEFSNFGGQARFAYQLNANGSWYAKPMVDLMVTNVEMDGFSERGGGGAALRVAGYDETVFSATPAIEVGNQWATRRGTLVRPYVRGGVSFYNDVDLPIVAGLAGAPGVAPFTTNGEIDDVLGNISAGVQILGVAGSVLSFSYDGSFGDTIEEHSASAKASMRF